MREDTLTHRDLARQLGVSETTVKSYRAKFPTFLPVARSGKPVRLHAEALVVCLRIRDLFADGLSIAQTADRLRSEFKEYPLNRRLSIAKREAAAEPVAGAGLHQLVEAQRQALDEARLAQEEAARRAEERIARLEQEVRNLATMEAASKALVADLIAELRAERVERDGRVERGGRTEENGGSGPRPEPTPPPQPEAAPQPPDGETVLFARKIVTVHGRQGASSYSLGREPKPEPPLPEAPQPPPEFLALPAVIRSERGEFLGLPGGQSIARLLQALAPRPGPAPGWLDDSAPGGPSAWTCLLPPERGRSREISFAQTTTPRGNLVGLIRTLRTGQAEASPQELQEFFRQVRDLLT